MSIIILDLYYMHIKFIKSEEDIDTYSLLLTIFNITYIIVIKYLPKVLFNSNHPKLSIY